jgi:1-acyl-sn-glycerol-3-phosphate acyltransferase
MSKRTGLFVILRMILILIAEIIVLSVGILIMAVGNLVSLGRWQDHTFRFTSFLFGRTALALAGIRMKVHHHGEMPQQPVVYLFNHSSTLDLFVGTALALPRVRYIAKRELGYNPLFWMVAKLSGQIMIDRKDPREAIKQMSRAYKYLRKRRFSLMLAPEGTRSRTGELLPFKTGAFHAAVELGYPIVPIYIEGAYELCPGSSLVAHPGTIHVHFHKMVDTSGWDRKSIRKHAEEMRKHYLEWRGEAS